MSIKTLVKILTSWLFTFWVCTCFSQQIDNPPALEKLLSGKTRFNDIVQTVDNYYAKAITGLGPSDTSTVS